MLLLCIAYTSCAYFIAPSGMKYCYEENSDNHADEILNIDGYYIGYFQSPFDGDTLCKTILLYKDGTCAATQFLANGKADSLDIKNILAKDKKTLNPFFWGLYKVYNDTLNVLNEGLGRVFSEYYMVDSKYKIMDGNTLRGASKFQNYDTIFYNLHFVHYPNNFDTKNNLKKYRWYRCKK